MAPEVVSGVVGGIVALFTSSITALLAWGAMQRERAKWMTDLKTSMTLKRYETRLAEYPRASEIIGRLSARRNDPLTPEACRKVGYDLNDWFYSAGGFLSDQSTRGAVLGLRDACLGWTQGPMPIEILEWRNAVLFCLRRDLDLLGLDEFDPADRAPLLKKLKDEVRSLMT